MGISKFIEEGYAILTTEKVVDKINSIDPNARVMYISNDITKIEDNTGTNKYLIDQYFKDNIAVQELMSHDEYTIVFCRFTKRDIEILKNETDSCKEETNLFEIKVKNLDSVPEVYYKGEKIDAKELVEYHWETKSGREHGLHAFEIKYLEKNEFSCKKITIREEM